MVETRREMGDFLGRDGVVIKGISEKKSFEVPVVDEAGYLYTNVSGINLQLDGVRQRLESIGTNTTDTLYERVMGADDLRTTICYTDVTKDIVSGISYWSNSEGRTVNERFIYQTRQTIVERSVV